MLPVQGVPMGIVRDELWDLTDAQVKRRGEKDVEGESATTEA